LTFRPTSSLTLLLLVAALAGAACGSDSPTGPTDPGETPVEITELFPPDASGTLTRNGGITHAFPVMQAGRITVTLTTLAPDSTAIIGMGLGAWNGVACAQNIFKDDATQGTSLIGNATATANYCVRVYDAAGTLTQPVEYQLTVTHF
jgi:hypothetical protein